MNDCDVNYRQSSNKRLLVELTLIQVAQITQEDDTPSAGRSPKRLKSLFKKLVKNVQAKVAPQGGTERSQKKNDEPTAPVVQPADTTPAAPATGRNRLSRKRMKRRRRRVNNGCSMRICC